MFNVSLSMTMTMDITKEKKFQLMENGVLEVKHDTHWPFSEADNILFKKGYHELKRRYNNQYSVDNLRKEHKRKRWTNNPCQPKSRE